MTEKKQLGILLVGYTGAISSTIVAGLDLIRQGLSPTFGMLTESITSDGCTLAQKLDLPSLSDIFISGWDLVQDTIGESICKHRVLESEQISQVSEETKSLRPINVPNISTKLTYTDIAEDWGTIINCLREDIRSFKLKHQLDHVVVVNCMSTQKTPAWSTNYDSLTLFQAACQELDPCVTASMQYACAALLEYAGYLNFTPNLVEIPPIIELAEKQGMPMAGHDGKTGQTLIKTGVAPHHACSTSSNPGLAPIFKLRHLKVDGWYSTNILGNRDGEALAHPDANKTKVVSKGNCLDNIMGYSVEDHQVHIHYYRPRKDNKEAWDNIDIRGFLGYEMQVKLNFLCRDSILAAPLIIDMARLMKICFLNHESGLLPQFSLFFKSPQLSKGTEVEHDLFKQREMFEKWLEQSEKMIAR